jgi:hypothetical protein
MAGRVTGHRLLDEGAPYTGTSCQGWPCDTVNGVQRVTRTGELGAQGVGGFGHARCECGWTGPHRMTGVQRRADHSIHKDQIRARQQAA